MTDKNDKKDIANDPLSREPATTNQKVEKPIVVDPTVIILCPEPGNSQSGNPMRIAGTASCNGNPVTIVIVDNTGIHPPITINDVTVDASSYWSVDVTVFASSNISIYAYCTGSQPSTGSSVSNISNTITVQLIKKIGQTVPDTSDTITTINLGKNFDKNGALYVLYHKLNSKNRKGAKYKDPVKNNEIQGTSAITFYYDHDHSNERWALLRCIIIPHEYAETRTFTTVNFVTHAAV